uniref:Uncharacterized protein n=1 Tax=Syphacia muris TaxID=451379 RepID=A0A0N5ASP6_9BILA
MTSLLATKKEGRYAEVKDVVVLVEVEVRLLLLMVVGRGTERTTEYSDQRSGHKAVKKHVTTTMLQQQQQHLAIKNWLRRSQLLSLDDDDDTVTQRYCISVKNSIQFSLI